MCTPDFFRARLDSMIDLQHPLAVLARRLHWDHIEQVLAPKFARRDRAGRQVFVDDLLGQHQVEFGGGVSNAGSPRLSIRLMASLLYLKNASYLSDEELVQRWSENVQYQFFSAMEYYEPRLPCDATQIGRLRRAIGEEGLEQLRKATIETAVEVKAVKSAELEREIVDTTVQEKAIAHPTAVFWRSHVTRWSSAARRAGVALKQTYAKEGKELRRKAGGYAHAKQFKRLRKTVKRQRTILGVVLREVQRKLDAQTQAIADGTGPQSEPSSYTAATYRRSRTAGRMRLRFLWRRPAGDRSRRLGGPGLRARHLPRGAPRAPEAGLCGVPHDHAGTGTELTGGPVHGRRGSAHAHCGEQVCRPRAVVQAVPDLRS